MDKSDRQRKRRTQRDYTMGFKLKVVDAVEKGDMTYKQAQSLKAQVRRGEKGTLVQYWKLSDRVPVTDERGKLDINEAGEDTLINLLTANGVDGQDATLLAAAIIGNTDPDVRVYVDGTLDTISTLPYGFSLAGTSQDNAYVGAIMNHQDRSLIKYFVGQIDDIHDAAMLHPQHIVGHIALEMALFPRLTEAHVA